jgi:hypothetical protein
MFQYTHPSGCDSLFSFLKMLMYVSIRAFHVECDSVDPGCDKTAVASTHALLAGCDLF